MPHRKIFVSERPLSARYLRLATENGDTQGFVYDIVIKCGRGHRAATDWRLGFSCLLGMKIPSSFHTYD